MRVEYVWVFIDYHYNFQMLFARYRFLLLLLLPLIARNQVLTPSSSCLGNCSSCDPFGLIKCLLPYPCDWNFYSEKGEGECVIGRSTQLVSHELFQTNSKNHQNLSKGWGEPKKKFHCEYASSEGKKYIQILGPYRETHALEKTFEVDPLSDSFELSFGLILDQWFPFNDYLIVDVKSKKQSLYNLEVSFESRVSVHQQPAVIMCEGNRVMTKKYSLKFPNNNRVDNKLTVTFTGYLENAVWGLTNLRLQQGCLAYSLFNPKTQRCNKCDPDSYLITRQAADWCEKCPLLCKTCESKLKCLSCVNGAYLNKSALCEFGDKYKKQVLDLGRNLASCEGQLKMAHPSNKISLTASFNQAEAYEQMRLGFVVYYLPDSWKNTSKSYISVKVNKAEVMRLDYRNLTNQAVSRCAAFEQNRAAKIELFSDKLPPNDYSAAIEFQLVTQEKGVTFGISSVRVKSLIKQKQPSPADSATQPNPAALLPVIAAATSPLVPSAANPTPTATTTPPAPTPSTTNTPSANIPSANTPSASTTPSTASNKTPSPNITTNPSATAANPVADSVKNNEDIQAVSKNSQDIQTSNKQTQLPSSPTNTIPQSTPAAQPNPTQLLSNASVADGEAIPLQTEQPPRSSAVQPSSNQQKFELGKYLNDLFSSNDDNFSISFISQSQNQASGIQIYVQNQIEEKGVVIQAFVDKLDKNSYSVAEVHFAQNHLSIFLQINKSFTDANIAIYKVATSRLLPEGPPQLIGTFKVARFDSLSPNEISNVQNLASIFSAVGWVAVVLIFAAVLLGVGVTVQQFVCALQMLFLHVYICCEYLPLTFRDVVGGLRLLQHLNFLAPSGRPTIVEEWMSEGAEDVPIRLQLYNQGVYFLKAFYPLIIVNLVYLLWFVCISYIQRRVSKEVLEEEKRLHHRLLDNIANRLVNFCDQVWRYQFITTLWFCFIQFYHLSSAGPLNALFCLLAFGCSIAWPCFVVFYSRKQYYECEYSEYIYLLEDLYYGKIPQYQLPSLHHRLGYPLFRVTKQFSFPFIICYFGTDSNFTLLSLMAFQVAEVLYAKGQQIYTDSRHLYLKMIENGLFLLIEFVLLVMFECDKIVSSNVFKAMGYFLSGVAILILLNSLLRVWYLARRKYQQLTMLGYDENFQLKKPKTQRVV